MVQFHKEFDIKMTHMHNEELLNSEPSTMSQTDLLKALFFLGGFCCYLKYPILLLFPKKDIHLQNGVGNILHSLTESTGSSFLISTVSEESFSFPGKQVCLK